MFKIKIEYFCLKLSNYNNNYDYINFKNMQNMQKISKLIGNLPEELKNIIISYTYNIQNHNLLQDIQSYQQTKDIISTIYYERNKHLLKYEFKADKYWLFSDLNQYMKTFYLTCYKDWLLIQRKILLSERSIENKINKIWSLLTPNQRDTFFQIRKLKTKK